MLNNLSPQHYAEVFWDSQIQDGQVCLATQKKEVRTQRGWWCLRVSQVNYPLVNGEGQKKLIAC